MTEPDGVSLRRRWTGRHYVHLLLPVPYLTEPAAAVLDDAVTAADGWRPYPDPDPAGARRWHRGPAAGTLRLAVLGWYPLLVTVGAEPAGGRPARRALGRLTEAALAVDGRPLSDAELPGRLRAATDRGAAAADLHERAARARLDLTRRRCPACPAISDRLATHCGGCDRRFTGADDERRDADHRGAARHLHHLAAELDRLARDRPMRAGTEDASPVAATGADPVAAPPDPQPPRPPTAGPAPAEWTGGPPSADPQPAGRSSVARRPAAADDRDGPAAPAATPDPPPATRPARPATPPAASPGTPTAGPNEADPGPGEPA
ncbi:hypothetical protein [Actinocatenispora thailandica]|uniref:hypothetical protein n=1 Tax=Actinocatenispora thailandica TaxID=227318 RepID=UPI00194F4F11|nr:hypothetical protein [Actinocatenispora thailandica]